MQVLFATFSSTDVHSSCSQLFFTTYAITTFVHHLKSHLLIKTFGKVFPSLANAVAQPSLQLQQQLAEKAALAQPIPQGFSSLLLKPYIKGVTHFQEVGWWKTWMVECVTLF